MKKIYYLDDEPQLCENFIELYSSNLISIETFSAPEKLIQRCSELTPDLIFLDNLLRDITGDEVARLLDIMIPKVLMTGDLNYTAKYPFIQVLFKPVDSQVIVNLIKKILLCDPTHAETENI